MEPLQKTILSAYWQVAYNFVKVQWMSARVDWNSTDRGYGITKHCLILLFHTGRIPPDQPTKGTKQNCQSSLGRYF
jgi:hypothetical protein